MVDTETTSGARVSHHINRKPASNMVHAVRVAEAVGQPLNQLVTFNFAHTDCPENLVSRQFERLRNNHFAPWLRRKGKGRPKPPAFIWSIENSGGCLNVHWLVHIPKGRVRAFRAMLPVWLATVAGEIGCASAIHVRHAPRPQGAAKYMAKGIDPLYAPFFRIRHVPQGRVHGKRVGVSRSLGPSVRRELQEAGRMKHTPRRFRAYPMAAAGAAA